MDEPTTATTADSGFADAATLAGMWGTFRLTQKVGQGAFGEVYRAFDTTLQREVALKLLLPAALDQESQIKSLLREARAIARVRHPNVVSVHGVDRHDGRVGFWSDFVHGKTLSAILTADGPFGAKEAALIVMDLCRAVGAVHAAGLLHRDIKSSNAMRESGGRILLLDFGLTHDSDSGPAMAGTAVYMAPELLSGQPATVATDIYALGILLFHLLTGRYPVDGATLQAIRVAHDAGTRSTLFDIRPDLPDALVRAAETAINPDPLKRYKSAGQMIAALHDAIGLGGSPAIPAPKRKSRWLFAAIPFVIVAAAAFLMRNATPIAAVEDDYLKAHDLVDHYYRPHALETAIPLLEKTVAKDPHFAPAFADLGRANLLQFTQLRDTKYIEPAREASLHALRIKRDLVSAHVTLGILYTRTGKNDLASQQLDEALKIDKFNASAYAALGNLYLSEGRNSEGEETLQKAATLDPGNWGILVELGSFYDESGKYAKAAEQYQRAADLAPDNARAQNNLGYVSRLQGHFQEADAAYRKAIALEPTAGHYRNLGQVLLEQGSYSEAVKMLEHAVQLKPDDYRAWGFLATVYASTGIDRPKVEATYRKAIALGKGLGQTTSGSYVLADLGNYYAALGVARQSESLLKQAVAGQPDSPQLLYEVAAGYELLHQREQSLLWIGKAIDAGVSPQFLVRIPQLTSLRADPRYPKTK